MAKGMMVDTSLCIGCKACQVACKEWNSLPAEEHFTFTGNSYDNTGHLTANTWRHVRFIEVFSPDRTQAAWYMMSDSCKHCTEAGCMEVCPTHAIIRTDLGNVVVQPDVCNGCRNCIPACPYGVISFNPKDGKVHKCTLCDDRIHAGLEPACAKACPTDSIVYGDVDELRAKARERVKTLQAAGYPKAQVYGEADILGGLNVFFLLLDDPEVYGQPSKPTLPQKNLIPGYLGSAVSGVLLGLAAVMSFRERLSRRGEE